MKNIPDLIDEIAEIGESPEGRNTIALTEVEDKAHDFVRLQAEQLFEQYSIASTDYEIRTDAFGNMFITLFGIDRERVVMSGSHVDSVKNGGKFDGVAGVASALSFLEKLLQSGKKLKNTYTVVNFRSEESSPATGVACLGSKVATGTITKEALESIIYKKGDGTEVPLGEHFADRYGADRWQEVLEELENPPINRDTVAFYEEVHIEQSKVGENKDADVAIVSGGIGGARREKVQVASSEIKIEAIETTVENPYTKFRINIHGEAAHTGGTPHAPQPFAYHDPSFKTRKDALVASAYVIDSILNDPKLADVHTLGIDIPKATGFTTVPTEQIIDIAVPRAYAEIFEQKWQRLLRVIQDEQHCTADIERAEILPGTTFQAINANQVLKATEIPRRVEVITESIIAKNANPVDSSNTLSQELEPDDSHIGEIRATVTDFQLTPEKGFRFNIDERNVNADQQATLAEDIGAFVDKTLDDMGISDSEEARKIISETASSPIAALSVKTKQKIADLFGLKQVTMPSMPGHDAGSVAKTGVSTSMTFIRHPGVSHNKNEFADSKYIENAIKLSHWYIALLLNSESDAYAIAA